ncbi:XdhC family protein [Arenimonas sp.]|uniref:XdhC family protein n=1 Tax=Arenimonas sp. TaxID=1872635 RepID=UPI0039E661B1
MNERLFARLAVRLEHEAVVLASVLETRGATPRKRGARMLIGAQDSDASVGGGLAEARVLAAARALLAGAGESEIVDIDLGGGPDAAGVCGGRMRIGLRCWQGAEALERARAIANSLASGMELELGGDEFGDEEAREVLRPDDRLLIVGAGHCGQALCELATPLDFDVWLFDAEGERLDAARLPQATLLGSDYSKLADALRTQRRVQAVLLNRDFHADVRTLEALAHSPPSFVGMMGSRKRIATVRAAVPGFDASFAHLEAPIGLDIGAQTPHEIAVSILARLISDRHARTP